MSDSSFHSNRRTLLALWGPVLLICVAGFVATWILFVGPPLPKTVRLGTGQPGGAYQAFGALYQQQLAKSGVQVELVPSGGSIANLKGLQSDTIDLAFVQGGSLASASEGKGLMALCSLVREPLWLFYREPEQLTYLTGLAGRRIAIGDRDSGTHVLAMRFATDNGLTLDPKTRLLPVGGREAASGLDSGEMDAALFIAAIEAPLIRQLIANPDLHLMNFARAEAYLRHYRFLASLTLPVGVLSLAQNIPAESKTLLAPTAMLIARNDLHPELIPLFLEAAKEIHGQGSLLDEPGEFPSTDYLDLPLNKRAKRYLEQGPGWLYRVLPYRVASQIDRLKILLLPLLSLLLPLLKLAPPLYRWRVRARVYRWYHLLREADLEISDPVSDAGISRARSLLDGLDGEMVNVSVPLSYMAEFYDLRLHIKYLRGRLEAATEKHS